MQSSHHPLKADLLLVLATLLAASGWMFSKEALAGLPPLLFMGIRFLLAGLILTLAGWRALCRLTARETLVCVALGGIFGAGMGFWVLGLAHGDHVGEGAFITSLSSVLVPVLALILFRDRPPLSTWLALPVAVAGMACLSLNQGLRLQAGQIYFLISALLIALLFNFNSRTAGRIPVLPLSAIQLSMVGLVTLAASAVQEPWPDAMVEPAILGWLLASVLLGTCARFFVQVSGQSLTTPSHAAFIMMLEPIWTALAAAFWLGESMSPVQFLGCGLIFLALLIGRWSWIARWFKPALAAK